MVTVMLISLWQPAVFASVTFIRRTTKLSSEVEVATIPTIAFAMFISTVRNGPIRGDTRGQAQSHRGNKPSPRRTGSQNTAAVPTSRIRPPQTRSVGSPFRAPPRVARRGMDISPVDVSSSGEGHYVAFLPIPGRQIRSLSL